MSPPDDPFSRPAPFNPAATGGATDPLDTGTSIRTGAVVPPFRRDFDNARDPYVARSALGLPANVTSVDTRFNSIAIQKFTANGTYTPTPGMRFCIIEAVGGGAGGGSVASAAADIYVGGGGGAGSYSRALSSAAQIGASQAVTIGSAGTGGAAGSNNGAAGGDTSVGSLCIAKGGSGGEYSSGAVTGKGGLGGIAGTGDFTPTGAPGGGGYYNSLDSVHFAMCGSGGSSIYGGGARVPNLPAAGNNATNYGSGGSGAASTGLNKAGGNGSAGVVLITEFIGA